MITTYVSTTTTLYNYFARKKFQKKAITLHMHSNFILSIIVRSHFSQMFTPTSFVPTEIKKSKAEEIPEYKRKRQAYYSSLTKNNAPDAFDFITKGANILNSGNIDLINQHFSKFAVQGDRDIAGNFIGFKDM